MWGLGEVKQMVQKIGSLFIPMILGSLLFQLSVIKFNLDIAVYGKIFNVVFAIILGILFICVKRRISKKIMLFYVIPAGCILIGYFANLTLEFFIGTASISAKFLHTSRMLPWLAALSVPFVRFNIEKMWRAYYLFMLVVTVIGLVEYLVFFGGILPTSLVASVHGANTAACKGIVTSFYNFGDSTCSNLHSRFYGIWYEAGTNGMLLLPAFVYAIFFSKRISILIFLGAIYFTYSLGASIALLFFATLVAFWKLREKEMGLLVVVIIIIFFIGVYFVITDYPYMQKIVYTWSDSGAVWLPLKKFIKNLYYLMTKYPFGLILQSETYAGMANFPDFYQGALTVVLYAAFVQGGLLAFFGYALFILSITVAIMKYYLCKHNLDKDKITDCAFFSLPLMLLYVVQRSTIFDSVVFSFLFAVPIIKMIDT
ncbi:MAG: hypothetical protein ACD_69C00103G0001, partial [uncultured bacterium]